MSSAIVWFRNDLRLKDNSALTAAVKAGHDVIPLYIHDENLAKPWSIASASQYWLYHSLQKLDAQLQKKGLSLILRAGDSQTELDKLVKESKASHVYWNRRYEPACTETDTQIKKYLKDTQIDVESFKSNLVYEPHEIKNKQGQPFKVFTPFWKHYQTLAEPAKPLAIPRRINRPDKLPDSLAIDALKLKPAINWYAGIDEHWQYGSDAAIKKLDAFIKNGLYEYDEKRDIPSINGISRMSPYLHFGEISPAMIWHRIRETEAESGYASPSKAILPFLRQLVWREFAHHLLFHFPYSADSAWRVEYDNFPWLDDKQGLSAWQQGRTGYPIVDAGMRELWHTGWMHNRVRMIVGSFLVKDLLIHWKHGAQWFWDTLLDADLANNSMGWQWVAGSGRGCGSLFSNF